MTAAELLSVAAFKDGRYAQAFPMFGSERTGAPVMSFCRIDDRPIRTREPVTEPDALVVQDPTLLLQFSEAFEAHPFLSPAPITPAYLGWAGLWVALILGLAGLAFQRRDI